MPEKSRPISEEIKEEIKSEHPNDVEVEKNKDVERENLPQVDKETGIYTDENGEEWATMLAAANKFGLSRHLIETKRENCRSIRGRVRKTGTVFDLYNLSDIQRNVSSLLGLPRVDCHTGVYIDSTGAAWSSIGRIAKKYGLHKNVVAKRLSHLKTVRAKNIHNNIVVLVELSQADDVLSKLANVPRVSQQIEDAEVALVIDEQTGIITDNAGARWITAAAASKLLGIKPSYFYKNKHNLHTKPIKISGNRIVTAIKYDDINKKLSALDDIPSVDDITGIYIDKNGERWVPASYIKEKIGIETYVIGTKKKNVRSLLGRRDKTVVVTLYNLSDVNGIVSDYESLPSVDPLSRTYIDPNGVKWISVDAASQKYGVSSAWVYSNFINSRTIEAKGAVGQVVKLYNVSEIEDAIKDFISLPQVDQNTGIYTDDSGERWATIYIASKILKIERNRLVNFAPQFRAQKGRARNSNKVYTLYNLSDVERVVPDLASFPLVDRDTGVYTDDRGERWVSILTAANQLGTTRDLITARINKFRKIVGRARNLSTADLYNLSDIEDALSDVITQKKESAQDRVLRESFEKKISELAEGQTIDAQKFHSLIDTFGAARCVDILYRLYPEFKGLPIEHVKGTMADYLGDFLITKGDFHPRDLEAVKPFLSDVTFRESLFETVKDHCLRYFFMKKREEPQRDSLEIIYEYLDNAASEAQGIDSKELDDIIQDVIAYYDAAIRDFEKPEVFKDRLTTEREFPDINQKINMKELADKKRVLIADEMGLGKSASVIMAKEQLGVECALVVAPANVIDTWKTYLSDKEGGYYIEGEAPKVLIVESPNDLNKATTEKFDYILISHERLTSDPATVEKLTAAGFDMLVVDEAHKLKNPTGQRADQAMELAASLDPENGYLALLSGTPVPNKVGDIAVALKMLYPEKFADVDADELSDQIINGDILDLRSLLMPRMQMKDLRESIEMPELTETVVPIALSAEERDIYEALLEDDEVTATEKMKILRQFLLNPDLVVLDPNLESSKITAARERLNNAFVANDKVVMFVNNYLEGVVRGESDIFEKLDLPADVRILKIHGNVSMAERKKIEQEFKDDDGKMLLVVSGQTADVGVDFSCGQKIIFYNEPWTEYQRRQELGRVYRPGIKNDLDSETLITEKTIEQGIHEYIWRKYRAVEKLLRGVPITELEKTLLKKTEQAEDPDLEVNPELARYYLSCWDKMMQYFGYAKEIGEVKFEKFLADYGRDYAEGYRELGNRSYQANANRIAGSLIDRFAEEDGLSSENIKILDLASGPEMLRRHISDEYQNRVVSLDINPHHLKDSTGDVVISSARKTPFKDKSFDYLNYALAWHYGKFVPSKSDFERAEILAEANRVLKKDGRLVLSLIYSVNIADEEKFVAVANELGFEIISEYNGEAVAENIFRSKVFTLKKIRDLDDTPADAAAGISSDNYLGLKLRTGGGSLKNSRKISDSFTLNGQEIKINLNDADKEALKEEQSVSREMERLKEKFEGIKNIPREEILTRKLARILIGKKFALFKKLERGSGAVVIKD